MSDQAVLEIIDRAVQDAGFRGLLERAPDEALAGYDLTAEERALFRSGTLGAERLEERVSKTDLSGVTTAKAASPILKPPSELKQR